jgi:subtilase family serine protease
MWYSLLFLILTLTSSALPIVMNLNYSVLTSAFNGQVYVTIVVPPKNLELLQLYVQQHIVLNKTQVEELFIPKEQINEILNHLSSYGIKANVTLNVITFYAQATVVEKALNGQFITFSIAGKKFYYFISQTPSVPGIILSTNLTSALFARPTNIYNVTQAIAYSYVTPQRLQTAYNVTWLLKRGINGSGVNIGILDFEGDPYIYQQLQAFDTQFNLPDPPLFKVVPIGPYNPNDGLSSGWALEISLDVEYAHAIAPNAGIILYVVNPAVSLPQAIAYIDQQDEVSVVSQSFGIPEIYFLLGLLPLSYLQSMIYEYWLGEVEGITFVAASGDAGGNGYNFYLSPLGSQIVPASIPYVLAVGGTSLFVSGNESVQTAWSGESVFGSTTGGYSSLFPSPPYQGLNGFRKVPDVVADANPYTGVEVVYYYNETILVGGTSLATPTVASIIALASEVHGKLGFVNPLIYSLKGTPALNSVNIGYNTPYIANSSYNLVSGLGYINAGYLVSLLKVPKASLAVAVSNLTALPNEEIKVVATLNGAFLKPLSLTAEIYNGSNIVGTLTLLYNGSTYVGNFMLNSSGIYEVVVSYDNLTGFSYIIDGYQAVFIFPIVAVYPIPSQIPVLAMITYPNGTLATGFNNTLLYVYKENQENGELIKLFSVHLTSIPIINISSLGITIKNKSGLLEGYLNYTNVTRFGGVVVLKVQNTIGIDEIVLGIYVVPAIIPNSFTEPTSVYPGENITILVVELGFGMPNITVSFIKDGITYWNFTVNAIVFNGVPYYIAQVTVPENLPPGYYTVKAYAIYRNISYEVYGLGYTQIYVAPYSLNYIAKINSTAFENSTVTVNVSITYPNGTPVKFGVFSAIFAPRYLVGDLDSLQLSMSVTLQYENGYWVGQFTIPTGNGLFSGMSSYEISGLWDVYIVGSSYTQVPIAFTSTLNYNNLNIIPLGEGLTFSVLPYEYVKFFNSTIGYNLYIKNAIFKDENVTLVNSIILNLTAINSTILLINSNVLHYHLVNSKIYSELNITNFNQSKSEEIVNTSVQHEQVNDSNVTEVTKPATTQTYGTTSLLPIYIVSILLAFVPLLIVIIKDRLSR